MVTREEYEQMKAFARIDGAVLGILWVISFACFIGQFSVPELGFVSMAVGVGSLVMVPFRLRRFRDSVLGGTLSFTRGVGYCMFVFFYASLLMAAAQFVYFQFLDHGFLLSQYAKMASSPEFKAMLQVYGVRNEEMKMMIDNLGALRPIDIALQFLTINIFLGLFISLPSAVMMMRSPRRKH